MSRDNGYNPLHWDCAKQGCFNKKKRPKIELFADCLPGRIAFTDIDAITEITGNLLLLEWKAHAELPLGQRILFERMTRACPAAVLVVEGDAEQMTVVSIRTVWKGVVSSPQAANLDRLRQEIQSWAQWAMADSALQNVGNNKRRPTFCNQPPTGLTHVGLFGGSGISRWRRCNDSIPTNS